MNAETTIVAEDRLGEGLRYTEETDPENPDSRRLCKLYATDAKEAVSELTLVPFTTRIGAAAVPAEGFAGVSTRPEHRGKGYIGILFRRTMASIAERASVAFLYGIEGLYGKYGFVSALPETSIALWTRRTAAAKPPVGYEAASSPDPSAVVRLYNEIHALRPWTHVRGNVSAEKVTASSTWRPGPRILVLRRGGADVAYALLPGRSYGQVTQEYRVSEAGAVDDESAAALLYEIGGRCAEEHLSSFVVQEPPDSAVGRAAMGLGATITESRTPDGGGMAAIIDRRALLGSVEAELYRRAAAAELYYGNGPAEDARLRIEAGVRILSEGLASGAAVPDDGDLVRLLLGYLRWSDLRDPKEVGAGRDSLFHAVFPGPSPWLPSPHSHRLDRY